MTHHASRITHLVKSTDDSRFTFWIVAAVLTTVYAATLAPDVTLWDAGEFNAAIGSLGIPHPPGTPLYIVLGNVWARGLGFLPQALAVNLLSAVATAIGCGLLGGLLARWSGSRLAGIAGGLSAGTMLAVWQNATETEVYAVSMLLAILMVVVGEAAGRRDSARLRVLLAYLMALAVVFQISALVAAPSAILLASMGPERARPDSRRIAALGGVFALVVAFSLAKPWLAAFGLVALLWPAISRRDDSVRRIEVAGYALLIMIGLSATLFMLVRAAHDPYVNQGNPSTLATMMDVVWRNQYPLPGLWPRRAPVWIQLLNLVQYADWQLASGVDKNVAASWWRTPFSIGALLLAVVGARWHRSISPRGAMATGLLIAMSSLGVVAMLNMPAGPSILDSILPPGSAHEPRERDYFFALAFAATGTWVGAGAVVVAKRWLSGRSPRLVAATSLGIAGLPVILNWRAADRRPDGMLATTFGEVLLASAPPNAVLLVAGDNDSYTVWYRQAVLGQRRDVTPVTVPLLAADWYRGELSRRHDLIEPAQVSSWRGEEATLRDLAANARRQGRPLAAAVSFPRDRRLRLAPGWTLGGMVFTAVPDSLGDGDRIDAGATGVIANLVETRLPDRSGGARDPALTYVARLLRCPAAALRSVNGDALGPLDSRCNLK